MSRYLKDLNDDEDELRKTHAELKQLRANKTDAQALRSRLRHKLQDAIATEKAALE